MSQDDKNQSVSALVHVLGRKCFMVRSNVCCEVFTDIPMEPGMLLLSYEKLESSPLKLLPRAF